jgi:hypothetical protein
LQTVWPAAFVWTPDRSRSAAAFRPDLLDPKRVLLRPEELPGDHNGFQAGGGYVDLCSYAPQLGPHVAYQFNFRDGKGIGIVLKTKSASLSVFRRAAPDLFRPLACPCETVGDWQGLRLPFRIGEGTKLFAVTLRDTDTGISRHWVVVVWRSGRIIGELALIGSPSLAMRLARTQFSHFDHTWTAPYSWLEEGLRGILGTAQTAAPPR